MLSRRLFAAGAAGAPAILAGAARAEEQPAESTIDRIKRGKVLRIAALPGEAPYFNKDIASGTWTGMCVEMAKDIAGVFDGQVEYLESTYGNSVLDLQANKIDLAFALNPTPKRALVIDFTHPFYLHGFGMVGKKGLHAENWSDLLAVNLGLTAVKKNPALGEFQMLHQPRVQLPTCMGIRMEPDKRWRDFLNAWVDYNRGIQQIREWLYAGLAINGVKPEDVPPDVEL